MKYVFFFRGKRYCMSEDQLEAAYRFRQMQYLQQDAKNHLDLFIFGDDPEQMTNFDLEYQANAFMEKYHMETIEAYALVDKIVAQFEHDSDCNLDENSQWENAIRTVLNTR